MSFSFSALRASEVNGGVGEERPELRLRLALLDADADLLLGVVADIFPKYYKVPIFFALVQHGAVGSRLGTERFAVVAKKRAFHRGREPNRGPLLP